MGACLSLLANALTRHQKSQPDKNKKIHAFFMLRRGRADNCGDSLKYAQLPFLQSSGNMSAQSIKQLRFFEDSSHNVLPSTTPICSMFSQYPTFVEESLLSCAALIHTAMRPANSAGLAGHPWSRDTVGFKGSGCATPSNSTHLCCDWWKSCRIFTTCGGVPSRSQHLIACNGATESKHFFKSSLAPIEHFWFILARSMAAASLECTSAVCLRVPNCRSGKFSDQSSHPSSPLRYWVVSCLRLFWVPTTLICFQIAGSFDSLALGSMFQWSGRHLSGPPALPADFLTALKRMTGGLASASRAAAKTRTS